MLDTIGTICPDLFTQSGIVSNAKEVGVVRTGEVVALQRKSVNDGICASGITIKVISSLTTNDAF
jgi:hypothetical protein